eukprot:g1804.t1
MPQRRRSRPKKRNAKQLSRRGKEEANDPRRSSHPNAYGRPHSVTFGCGVLLAVLCAYAYASFPKTSAPAIAVTFRILPSGATFHDHATSSDRNATCGSLLFEQNTYYDARGRRVSSKDECSRRVREGEDVYVVSSGDLFVWPAPKRGTIFENVVEGTEVKMEVLLDSPRVFRVRNFLSQEEADDLVAFSQSEKNAYRMSPSTTGTKSWKELSERERELAVKAAARTGRTSNSGFVTSTPTAMRVKRRVSELLRFDAYAESRMDGVQVLRYNLKEAYIPHFDFFEPRVIHGHDYDSANGGTNRFATVFLYLSDVSEGGQTVFPKAERADDAREDDGAWRTKLRALIADESSWEAKMVEQCYTRFSTEARKGDAVLFYSQHPNGTLDRQSLHGGCPVLEGQKWAANVWVWNGCRSGIFGFGRGDGSVDVSVFALDENDTSAVVVSGLLQGGFGIGGGVMMISSLQRVVHLNHVTAVATSTPLKALSNLIGGFTFYQAGFVDVDVAMWIGLSSCAGSFIGARVGKGMNDRTAKRMFGGVLAAIAPVIVGLSILKANEEERSGEVDDTITKEEEEEQDCAVSPSGALLSMAGLGLSAGALSGAMGIGGAPVMIAYLTLFPPSKLCADEYKACIGTSVCALTFTTTMGTVAHACAGSVRWAFVPLIAVGSSFGSFCGSRLAIELPSLLLQSSFAVFCGMYGLSILLKRPPSFFGAMRRRHMKR